MKTGFCAFIIFLSCCVSPLWAHKGAQHEKEILAVLGINGAQCTESEVAIFDIPANSWYKNRIQWTLNVFQDCIDRDATNNELYNKIKEVMEPYHFTYYPNDKRYGHRVFFHWGFNTNPKESKALCECFDFATEDQEVQARGWKLLIDEQGRRNWKMYDAIRWLAPVPRAQQNAFATLLYDVHILGDYIEGVSDTQKAMIPFDALIDDISKHAIGNFDCQDNRLKIELQKKINDARHKDANTQLAAKRILVLLINHVPELIENTKIMKKLVWGNKANSAK